jgi:sucrose-6-phosphate hydrolase SacC (GH32 family)
MPFNQSMSIPFALKLLSAPDGPRLARVPVTELQSLRVHSWNFEPVTLNPERTDLLANVKAELMEIDAAFDPGDAEEVDCTVRGASIVYDVKAQTLTVNGHRAPAPLRRGQEQLRVFCDRTALEVFASDGLTYIPLPFAPKADNLSLSIQVKGGSARFRTLQAHELKSAWR